MPKPLFLTGVDFWFCQFKVRCFVLLCVVLFTQSSVSQLQVSDEEPVICQKLKPPKNKPEQLVDWLLKNGHRLKHEGCWKSHISLGTRGMEEAAKQSRFLDRARIALNLSSSYFCLGDYDSCRKLAEEASHYAREHKDWKEYITSLYLLSGVSRAQGRKEAVYYAEKGMEELQKHQPDDHYLKAKILYNLGGALSDLEEPDLDRARAAMMESHSLYHGLKNQYEIVRSGLRLARIDYLKGNYISALAVIQSVEVHLERPRSRMLYHYMMAKILHRMKKWGRARTEALESLAWADRLKAKVDEERTRTLLDAIDNKTFVKD
ncbi:tetratricopeptide repeat protein [Endozoicomonas numazuensis]|nr:tetratricopeptide repeat protein [Endozoicomonas numazuensis]